LTNLRKKQTQKRLNIIKKKENNGTLFRFTFHTFLRRINIKNIKQLLSRGEGVKHIQIAADFTKKYTIFQTSNESEYDWLTIDNIANVTCPSCQEPMSMDRDLTEDEIEMIINNDGLCNNCK
jgi:hypothetical protein